MDGATLDKRVAEHRARIAEWERASGKRRDEAPLVVQAMYRELDEMVEECRRAEARRRAEAAAAAAAKKRPLVAVSSNVPAPVRRARGCEADQHEDEVVGAKRPALLPAPRRRGDDVDEDDDGLLPSSLRVVTQRSSSSSSGSTSRPFGLAMSSMGRSHGTTSALAARAPPPLSAPAPVLVPVPLAPVAAPTAAPIPVPTPLPSTSRASSAASAATATTTTPTTTTTTTPIPIAPPPIKSTAATTTKTTTTSTKTITRKPTTAVSDNFVRIDLKRGWREHKKGGSGRARVRAAWRDARKARASSSSSAAAAGTSFSRDDSSASFATPTLPSHSANADDVVDVCLSASASATSTSTSTTTPKPTKVPMCHHDLPCVERVVSKTSTGNKGRQFFCCSVGMAREGGCGFFAWVDDTKDAALRALAASSSPQTTSTEEPTTSPFDDMSVRELRAWLASRGRTTSSAKRKEDLLALAKTAFTEDEAATLELRALIRARPTSELTPNDLDQLLAVAFKHDAFRDGQRDAVERVLLRGESTLVVRATGSGKSLLYQLPALALPGLTLVISPLVALMQDQVAKLPPGLRGAVLSSHQTAVETANVVGAIQAGRVDVLFVAPERVFTSSFVRLMRHSAKRVSLVCVDEAHCVSSWSHNFRPAFLRLGEAIDALAVEGRRPVVLALTATATKRVAADVCSRLGIDPAHGALVQGSWLRDNLELVMVNSPLVGVSGGAVQDADISTRITALMAEVRRVVEGAATGAAIVYTSTKAETEILAERLSAESLRARAYHAGMTAHDRKRVQEDFMSGSARVVVATVAFGMGLDKSDVRLVAHFRAPRSIEDYVQETGRAGRDGARARCVCFLDTSGAEHRRALSLARSDGVEEEQVHALLGALLDEAERVGPVVAVPLDAWGKQFDVREGVLETMLVKLASEGVVRMLPSGYARLEISGKASSSSSSSAATTTTPVPAHAALVRLVASMVGGGALLEEEEEEEDGWGASSRAQRGTTTASVPITRVMRACGADSPSAAIRVACDARDAGLFAAVRVTEACLWVGVDVARFRELGVAQLTRRAVAEARGVEDAQVRKLHAAFAALQTGVADAARFRTIVTAYLEGAEAVEVAAEGSDGGGGASKAFPFRALDAAAAKVVAEDFRSLLRDMDAMNVSEPLRTARALARIVHGVASPAFPAERWRTHQLWGRHAELDFDGLLGVGRSLFSLSCGAAAAAAAAAKPVV